MQGSAPQATAAFAVAALLLALALARSEPPRADCAAPQELAAVNGHTRVLGCAASAPGREPRGPARGLVGLPIDPNLADAATLETLPGIGPARAAAIVAERSRGRFARVEDLTRVPGIGPRTLAGLRDRIGVADAPLPRELGRPRQDPVGCPGGCARAPREGAS